MKKELAQKWVNALRSGEYKQAKRILYDKAKDAYCCLGVLNRINGNKEADVDLLVDTHTSLGLNSDGGLIGGTSLSSLNDSGLWSWEDRCNINKDFSNDRFTFDEIADVIQAEYIEGIL